MTINSPAAAKGLGTNQRVLLAALAGRGTSYLKELHRDTGIPVGHVARSLAAFRARGLAEPATLPARRGLPDSVRPVRLTAAGREAASRKSAGKGTPSGADRASKTPRGPVVGRGNPKERS